MHRERCSSEWKFAADEIQSCLARRQAPLELRIFDCREDLGELGPRSAPLRNKIIASDRGAWAHGFGKIFLLFFWVEFLGPHFPLVGEAVPRGQCQFSSK